VRRTSGEGNQSVGGDEWRPGEVHVTRTVFAAELWARAKWAAEGMKKETEGSKKDTDQR
jgi:hypothetical protein